MSSGSGVFMVLLIFSSWFIVDNPGNKAFPRYNSAMRQPADHMSMLLEYQDEERSTSGDRYQRVAT